MKLMSIRFRCLVFSFLGLVFFMCSCHHVAPKSALSDQSHAFLTEVVELLRTKSVHKHTINWKEFEKDVFLFAQNSQTIEDTYPAVAYAVRRLEDKHSYFSPARRQADIAEQKTLPILKDEKVPEDIGYIRIPFCIGNEAQTEHYIASVSSRLLQQNSRNIKGWIIDLRDNFGGNMWPMLVALGPLLQPGTQGYFLDADATYTTWYFEKGKAYMDSVLLAENKEVFNAQGQAKLAILMNNKTASSGEAIAVVFKGYANAKFFGEPSFGVSTGCESFTLSDGSRINLATSVFVDRNKIKYGGSLNPDVPCSEAEALSKAIEWIYQ